MPQKNCWKNLFLSPLLRRGSINTSHHHRFTRHKALIYTTQSIGLCHTKHWFMPHKALVYTTQSIGLYNTIHRFVCLSMVWHPQGFRPRRLRFGVALLIIIIELVKRLGFWEFFWNFHCFQKPCKCLCYSDLIDCFWNFHVFFSKKNKMKKDDRNFFSVSA